MPTPLWSTRTRSTTKPTPTSSRLPSNVLAPATEVRVATDDGDLRTACTAYNIVVETADEFVQLFLRA